MTGSVLAPRVRAPLTHEAMAMALRDVLLLGSLVAIGSVGYVEQRERNRRRLSHLLRRKRRLEHDLRALRRQRQFLKAEAHALRSSRYYIERIAREQLGWLPVAEPQPDPRPDCFRGGSPSELVRAGGSNGQPARGPGRPNPLPAARAPSSPQAQGRQMLAALGYRSVKHFQRKMIAGRRPDGVLDAATLARAGALIDMLHRTGFASVKRFQSQHGLTADGVFGRRTERRAKHVLSARAARRRALGRSGVVVHRGEADPARPGG